MSDPQGDRTLTLNAIRGRGWRALARLQARAAAQVVNGQKKATEVASAETIDVVLAALASAQAVQ